jgi:hypothetical protein
VRAVTAVVLDINLSLDGFVAAEGSRPGQPLGDAGERLREWATGPDAYRAPELPDTAGALICGRRTYDPAEPPTDSGYTCRKDADGRE